MSQTPEVPGAVDAPPSSPDAAPAGSQAAAAAGNEPSVADGNFALPSLNRAIGKQISGPIELLKDVDLNVKIELGRTRMLIEDVLRLAEGSVVELDKLAGDPVDVYVNEQLVARGEVLVLNDNFCVRINEIVTATEE
jgi:flagellar motor switch protein FliN/FliY